MLQLRVRTQATQDKRPFKAILKNQKSLHIDCVSTKIPVTPRLDELLTKVLHYHAVALKGVHDGAKTFPPGYDVIICLLYGIR